MRHAKRTGEDRFGIHKIRQQAGDVSNYLTASRRRSHYSAFRKFFRGLVLAFMASSISHASAHSSEDDLTYTIYGLSCSFHNRVAFQHLER